MQGTTITVKKVSTDDNHEYVVQYDVPTPPEGTLSFVSRAGSKVGYNVTNYACLHSRDGLRHDMAVEYALIGDTWVPSSVSARWAAEDGEHLRFQRTLVMEDIRINEPIDPRTFSFASLGLEDGERVLDRIDSQLYVYLDGELLTPAEHLETTLEPPRQRWMWVLWLNLLVLLLIACVVWRQRRFSVT